MSETIDHLAREFVDDRLTPERRAEIERRIALEPELAQRVEELRRIGKAVRSDGDDELSPEFYARARARFESAGGRSWFRPVSWETAGLLAAAALALVLLVPPILEQEDLGVPQPTRQVAAAQSEKISADSEMKRTESAAADLTDLTLADSDDIGDAVTPGDTSSTESDRRERPSAPSESIGSSAPADEADPSVTREVARGRVDAVEPLNETNIPADEGTEDHRSKKKQESDAEAGARGVASQTPEVRSQLVEEEVSSEIVEQKLSKEAGRKSVSEADPVTPPHIVDGYVLQAGRVPAGDIRELRSDEARELLGQIDDTDRFQDKNQNATRLLLIGPRDPAFGCSGITLQQVDAEWWISLPSVEAEFAAIGGCAVELPDDGRSVRIRSHDE